LQIITVTRAGVGGDERVEMDVRGRRIPTARIGKGNTGNVSGCVDGGSPGGAAAAAAAEVDTWSRWIGAPIGDRDARHLTFRGVIGGIDRGGRRRTPANCCCSAVYREGVVGGRGHVRAAIVAVHEIEGVLGVAITLRSDDLAAYHRTETVNTERAGDVEGICR